MLAEDIHLYGKKIKDILGHPMDFFVSFLKNKHKLRKTAFVIWQIEIPYLQRASAVMEQERRMMAAIEEEKKKDPDYQEE